VVRGKAGAVCSWGGITSLAPSHRRVHSKRYNLRLEKMDTVDPDRKHAAEVAL